LWAYRFVWEPRAVTALSVVVFVVAMALVIQRVVFFEA
jgi:hypothetical protein